MAPKRPSLLEYPPSASSSEDEELESVEEEEVMDEEAPHGDNEEEEEEELVPDSHLLKSAAEHEQADSDYSDDTPLVKKPKTAKPAEDSKKQGQRVFNEESEVVILKGMEEFISKYGKDFMADFNELYEYVKTGLNVDVSKSQLVTKIHNLKKKYRKTDEKVKKGEELKPRYQTLYDLSKKIWGDWDVKIVNVVMSDVSSSLNAQAKRVKKKKVVMVEKKEELRASEMDEVESDDGSVQFLVEAMKSEVAGFGIDEEWVRRGVSLIEKTKRDELVKKWKNLLVNESMLNLRHLELIREQKQLAHNAFLASLQREFDSFNDA